MDPMGIKAVYHPSPFIHTCIAYAAQHISDHVEVRAYASTQRQLHQPSSSLLRNHAVRPHAGPGLQEEDPLSMRDGLPTPVCTRLACLAVDRNSHAGSQGRSTN